MKSTLPIAVSTVLVIAFAFAQAASADSPLKQEAKKPNVLLILVDDLGYSDTGAYGSEIETPNIDAIANQGLRFTQFYNTGRCWPTRAALLTGYYAQGVRRDYVNGLKTGNGGNRPAWAMLLPEYLREAGYRSYHTGKWHIDSMPIASGFDRSYYLGDQGRFFNPVRHWQDDKKLPAVEKDSDFYATVALADHAVSVLKEHQENFADQPFFHYLAFTAPHFPLHALPEDIAHYDDLYQQGWDQVRQSRWEKIKYIDLLDKNAVDRPSVPERNLGPPYHFKNAFEVLGPGELNRPQPWASLSAEQQEFQAKKMAIQAAMIHRVDIELGRVFEQIRDMGQWDNTLILFLSDNGASAEIMVRDDGHDPQADPGSADTYLCLGPGWSTVANTPFRRHKTWTHEGGISTPLIVSWPKGVEAKNQTRHTPGHVIDVVPTILELAGIEQPNDNPPFPGQSLVPTFEDDSAVARDAIWWYHDGHRAIRDGDWKAVAPVGEPWELYNLAVDRIESNNLAIPNSDQLQRLVRKWEAISIEQLKLATSDQPAETQQKVLELAKQPYRPNAAQEAALPKRRQVLPQGKSFLLNGRHAFLMEPEAKLVTEANQKPWIFYGPTLNDYPDQAERWMHEKFLAAGVAVAGIDVGEAYGSPHALQHFDALYDHMVEQGYSKKPALLGRSRGGLWASSFAIAHPERIAGLGGIYPVYDYTTYPGVERAATAYGQTPSQLLEKQDELNPIKRMDLLAKAKIPVCIIHGTDDKVVPIDANSEALESIYRANQADEIFTLIKADGQGHSFWEGFFHCQELVDFLIDSAKSGAR